MDEWEEHTKWTAFDLATAGFTRICSRRCGTDEADLNAYAERLDGSPSESDLQRFLQDHPRMLHGERGSLCRWAKAQPQLGNQFRPDFLVARIDSYAGVRWTLVELQRPDVGLFTQDKRTTDQFDEGVRQILEWRDWISENGDYARKPKRAHGLGLAGLTHKAEGLILIGRRREIPYEDRLRARSLTWPHHIEVHTYDWLADEMQQNIEFWQSYSGSEKCEECESISYLAHRRQRSTKKSGGKGGLH